MPSGICQLIVTSPPYFNERAYSQWDTIDLYFRDMKEAMKGCLHVIKEGGIIVWNVQHFGEEDLASRSSVQLQEAGFRFLEFMVWVKPSGMAGPRVKHISANGLYYPSIVTEGIFVYYKGKRPNLNILDAGERAFMLKNYQTNVWNINPVVKIQRKIRYEGGLATIDYKNVMGHLAPFPEKLVIPFILAYSKKNDLIMDPFCGSGTTCRIAKMYSRRWCGIDVNEEYVKLAEQRLNEKDLFSINMKEEI